MDEWILHGILFHLCYCCSTIDLYLTQYSNFICIWDIFLSLILKTATS